MAVTPTYSHAGIDLYQGDCRDVLAALPDGSVQCVVTSPPYFGLRSYLGADHPEKASEVGTEQTPQEYVDGLVAIFREVRRVLRDDGTCWINLGDSFASAWPCNRRNVVGQGSLDSGKRENRPPRMGGDLKDKDLMGIPWMVAFALRADGWWLRSEIIWSKPSCMPEGVTDRPTRAHETIFLLSKRPVYYYDAEAIAEDAIGSHYRGRASFIPGRQDNDRPSFPLKNGKRNKRTVWTVASQPYLEAHFATFPPKLIEPCILAGAPAGGVVLDPFAGAGTTLMVAKNLGRQAIGIELNEAYCGLIVDRLRQDVLALEVPA